jgi:competence ComEA-like helix-hairpin-helix protein
MIRTLIAAAVGAAALAGGSYYATGAAPFLDAPQPVQVAQAAPAAPSAPQGVPTAAGDGSAVVLSCEPQRAAQGPAQAVKAQEQAGTGALDANTATAAQFDALPARAITPEVAQAIVDYRTAHGRFTSVAELDKVTGIGAATMARLPGLVHV